MRACDHIELVTHDLFKDLVAEDFLEQGRIGVQDDLPENLRARCLKQVREQQAYGKPCGQEGKEDERSGDPQVVNQTQPGPHDKGSV